MNKLIVIGGPTSSGKTNLAIEIAKKYNGELVNADSRQIYKYLDIGTNKGQLTATTYIDIVPLQELEYEDQIQSQISNLKTLNPLPVYEIKGIKLHLVNFLNPDVRFNLHDYKILADNIIDSIFKTGKQPILVGGTGLYIDAIIKNYKLQIINNKSDKFKKELEQKSVKELQDILRTANFKLLTDLNESDIKNPRRLIRLIEKSKTNEIPGTRFQIPKYKSIFLYPDYNWEELKVKIEKRVEQMFGIGERRPEIRDTETKIKSPPENIISETKKVLAMGFSKDSVALQGIGYKQVIEYLDGEYDLKKCIEHVKIAHRQYARRQRTWFETSGRNYELIKVNSIYDAENLLN